MSLGPKITYHSTTNGVNLVVSFDYPQAKVMMRHIKSAIPFFILDAPWVIDLKIDEETQSVSFFVGTIVPGGIVPTAKVEALLDQGQVAVSALQQSEIMESLLLFTPEAAKNHYFGS